jgi:phospholipid/cholesterol/gamma-HCH transport system substrate-binding protein
MVVLDVQERHVLRKDSQARLMSSLLGDPSIEFSPGKSRELLKPGTQLTGEVPANAVEIVRQFESKMTVTMESFAATSREWSLVGRNLNSLMSTHRGNLDLVVERAAESLHQFTQTMQNANQLFGDPENQRNIRETLASLAAMSHETRTTIASARTAVESAQHNLDNLKGVTSALARHSESIAGKLDHSAGNLELLLAELNQFARHLSDEEGSLKLLATDPSLYRNLNRSASSLDILLRNLQPITEDLRILSDKLARHPELLGVRGALQGSTGLKTTDEAAPHTPGRISIGPVKNPR